jgi:hypothetical protein
MNYSKNISKFNIVNKDGQSVSFLPNNFQEKFLTDMSGRDVILKARQCGFSSLILAMFTLDFLREENSRSVCISHDGPSATKLLDRVKYFLDSAKAKGLDLKLKYNSRYELVNEEINSTFYIGASGSKSFGRGDTLTNLHLSEFAFYDDPKSMLASALQAVVPQGKVIIESTANGMNYLKEFWDKSKSGDTGFKTHFFGNTFYAPEFLEQKRKELADLFPQEYPATDTEAFLSSGNPFFDLEALKYYLTETTEPISTYPTHYDLAI